MFRFTTFTANNYLVIVARIAQSFRPVGLRLPAITTNYNLRHTKNHRPQPTRLLIHKRAGIRRLTNNYSTLK